MIIPFKAGSGAFGTGTPQEFLQIEARMSELEDEHRSPLLVISAFPNMTNLLEEVWQLAVDINHDEAKELLEDVFDKNRSIGLELMQYRRAKKERKQRMLSTIEKIRLEACDVLDSLHPNRMSSPELQNRAKAALLSYGERLAVLVFAEWIGFKYQVLPLDARSIVQVSSTGLELYTNAAIDWNRSIEAIKERTGEIKSLLVANGAPNNKVLWLLEGFIGSASDGHVATLPREGSDLSEVWAAHAFESPAYFLKTLKPGLKSMPLRDLAEFQRSLGSHLIGYEAIEAALKYSVPLVIIDVRTGARYDFAP